MSEVNVNKLGCVRFSLSVDTPVIAMQVSEQVFAALTAGWLASDEQRNKKINYFTQYWLISNGRQVDETTAEKLLYGQLPLYISFKKLLMTNRQFRMH